MLFLHLHQQHVWVSVMIKNYIIIAFRNLFRHKAYSFLNLAGLSVSLAISILILFWVRDELSYDRFHSASGEIFRLTMEVSDVKVALTPPPLGPAIKAEMPEIVDVTQIASTIRLFSVEDKSFEEKKVYFAEPSFLEMFDFSLLKGDVKTALSEPDGLLISQAIAEKYFGLEDPVGKTIQMDNNTPFTVKGVLHNVPPTSHLQFDILLPLVFLTSSKDFQQNNSWRYNSNMYTYVRLRPEVASNASAVEQLRTRIDKLYAQHETETKVKFSLQPLGDIYLNSADLMADRAVHGDKQYVRVFSFIAIFILIIAAINFMNLATARATERSREVGMRKTLGAHSWQLIGQFLGESLLVALIALPVALLLVTAALPSFNELTGKNLQIELFDVNVARLILAVVVVTGLIAGSYPAFYMSTFRPIQSLKNIFKTGPKSRGFRNALVVLQFVITIILVVATGIVYQQIQFIKNQNLGFDRENLIYVKMNREMFSNYGSLRTELEASDIIENFAISSDLPNNIRSATIGVEWDGKNTAEQPVFRWLFVDENFLKVMSMKVLEGRTFFKELNTDSANYIVNEKALKIMGVELTNAVGRPFAVNGKKGQIVGVVQDFHFSPLQQEIEPLIIEPNNFGGFVLVRIKPSVVNATVQELQRIFNRLTPKYPFEYSFLDSDYQLQYQTEERIGTISKVFAALAIFVASLGLFGLSAFVAQQRVREIGVRKIMGASVLNIVLLLSRNFIILVILAMILATPVAWYLMNQWLESYAYHISIDPMIFIYAGIIALFVALVATSFQTVKAAMANPVKSLRNE